MCPTHSGNVRRNSSSQCVLKRNQTKSDIWQREKLNFLTKEVHMKLKNDAIIFNDSLNSILPTIYGWHILLQYPGPWLCNH